jgi:hypothetical protein
VELNTGREDAADYGCIGVKSRHVRMANGETENTFACRVLRVVEDERRLIVVLATPAGSRGYSSINMTIGYEAGQNIKIGDEMLIYISPDDIMLLRK